MKTVKRKFNKAAENWVTSCLKRQQRSQIENDINTCSQDYKLIRGGGDKYLISQHGLIFNNDVLVALKKYIKSDSVDLIITSPPYNLGNKHHTGNKKTGCYSDDMPESDYQKWQIEVLNECYRILKPTGSMMYNHKNRIKDYVLITPYEWILKTKFIRKQELIWINGSPNVDKQRFFPYTERVYWLTKSKYTRLYNSEKKTEVFTRKDWKPTGTKGKHTRRFPTSIPLDLIQCFPDAEIILDPFAGYGTVALAAEILEKKWIGIEKDKNFCADIFSCIEIIKEINEDSEITT
jgi:site-specific DNA-methyltransferase (adenine-specific)